MICKTCDIPMRSVMSFSQDKYEKFNKSLKCYSKTKHQKLNDNEMTFGEVLSKEIRKHK